MKEMESQTKTSLKLQAYQYLKTKILNCEYRPNEFLNEQKLCAEMGNISRTPMRDALGRLEQEGLIYPVKGKGNFIADSQEVRKASVNAYKRELKSLIQKGKAMGMEEEELIYIIRECYKEGMS